MSLKFVLTALFFLTILTSASAKQGKLGLGIILGDPTGLSGKMWISNKQAIDGALSYDFRHSDFIYLHSDFLMHTNITFLPSDFNFLLFYYGIGARVLVGDNPKIGARLPFGLDFLILEAFDIFVEIVPVVDLLPGMDISMNGGLGFRYFF